MKKPKNKQNTCINNLKGNKERVTDICNKQNRNRFSLLTPERKQNVKLTWTEFQERK